MKTKKMMMLTTTAYMSERFNRNNILLLEELGYEVHVVANFEEGNPTTDCVLKGFKHWIKSHGGKWIQVGITRNPTDISNNFRAYKQIIHLIYENKYEFIHCHTPIGGVLGRIAARRTGTKVIYTAHGFHFYTGASLLNWLIYYPIEHFLSRWTDILVLINQEDYQRAKTKFHARQVVYVPGVGIDTAEFDTKIVHELNRKEQLGISEENIVLLSVGELNRNKNHEAVIRAIAKLHNETLHYVVAGQGKRKEILESLSTELGIGNQIHLLGYCENVPELLKSADLFIFPSKREGLPVAVMEAIASKTPVLCSNIRGNKDLIQDESYLFHPDDVDGICKCIQEAIQRDHSKCIGDNLKRLKYYERSHVCERMKELYSTV